MGTLFGIVVFAVIAFLVVGGLLFLSGRLEDSSPFVGKAVLLLGLGVIITVAVAIVNEAIKSIPTWITP